MQTNLISNSFIFSSNPSCLIFLSFYVIYWKPFIHHLSLENSSDEGNDEYVCLSVGEDNFMLDPSQHYKEIDICWIWSAINRLSRFFLIVSKNFLFFVEKARKRRMKMSVRIFLKHIWNILLMRHHEYS